MMAVKAWPPTMTREPMSKTANVTSKTVTHT